MTAQLCREENQKKLWYFTAYAMYDEYLNHGQTKKDFLMEGDQWPGEVAVPESSCTGLDQVLGKGHHVGPRHSVVKNAAGNIFPPGSHRPGWP